MCMMYPCRGSAMATNAFERQLTELETSRYRFERGDAGRVVTLLNRLDAARFSDPALLIRFHETLLFLRAFPQGPSVVRATERILDRFYKKVEALRKAVPDMDLFDSFATSGIAGTQMEDTLSFDVARWLVRRLPGQVEVAWENYDPGRELGNLWSALHASARRRCVRRGRYSLASMAGGRPPQKVIDSRMARRAFRKAAAAAATKSRALRILARAPALESRQFSNYAHPQLEAGSQRLLPPRAFNQPEPGFPRA